MMALYGIDESRPTTIPSAHTEPRPDPRFSAAVNRDIDKVAEQIRRQSEYVLRSTSKGHRRMVAEEEQWRNRRLIDCRSN